MEKQLGQPGNISSFGRNHLSIRRISRGSSQAWFVHVEEGRREAIIYNAVDFRSLPEYPPEERHSIRKRYGFDEEDVVLVNMGMLNRQKSQEHLLEAMPNVLEGHPDVKLMIVGWGERESFLKDCVLSKRLEKHVFLAGNAGGRRCLKFFSWPISMFPPPSGKGSPSPSWKPWPFVFLLWRRM